MPVPMKITGRSSSITNAFVNSIIPIMHPSENDIKDSLELLGMTVETIECIYCGSKYTEWDHLRPLVLNKKPTGYISEIQNLVPSCGKCNQSKGNKEWLLWINSSAKLSPKSKQVSDLKSRIEKLKKYEEWKVVTKLNIDVVKKKRHQVKQHSIQVPFYIKKALAKILYFVISIMPDRGIRLCWEAT